MQITTPTVLSTETRIILIRRFCSSSIAGAVLINWPGLDYRLLLIRPYNLSYEQTHFLSFQFALFSRNGYLVCLGSRAGHIIITCDYVSVAFREDVSLLSSLSFRRCVTSQLYTRAVATSRVCQELSVCVHDRIHNHPVHQRLPRLTISELATTFHRVQRASGYAL